MPRPALRADVVVLKSGRAHAGVIEQQTSQSLRLYDGNLRRVIAVGEVAKIVRERPDTSWVIVGDLMVQQSDWQSAAEAYEEAMAQTDQPHVVLERIARLRAYRYRVSGAEEAQALLQEGKYAEAAKALHTIVRLAQGAAERNYWTGRLAEAYAGLAAQAASTATATVNPYLVYALSIAPECASAHAVLAEHLRRGGHSELSRRELVLALDLDPIDPTAQSQLASLGEGMTYDPRKTNLSGLVEAMKQRRPLIPAADAALSTAAVAQAISSHVASLGPQPARLLIASFLIDPTVALAYEGRLPYPGYEPLVPTILQETDETVETTPYDKAIIAAAITVQIDPRLVRAIARVRGKMEPSCTLPDGARGLVPLSRRQWEVAARQAVVKWDFDSDWKDPAKNLPLACRYLDWLRREVLRPYAGNRLDDLKRVHDNL